MAKKVLVVEDVDHNRKLIYTILSSVGYTIVENEDGHDVVGMAIEEKPDVILMDIQLPKKSGTDIIKELRANDEVKHIPILAVTAFAMDHDRARIMDSGCDDYLSKPFKSADLIRKVETLTGEDVS